MNDNIIEECSICLRQDTEQIKNTHVCTQHYCYDCAIKLRNICCICNKVISIEIKFKSKGNNCDEINLLKKINRDYLSLD